jgi:hypothetical protein
MKGVLKQAEMIAKPDTSSPIKSKFLSGSGGRIYGKEKDICLLTINNSTHFMQSLFWRDFSYSAWEIMTGYQLKQMVMRKAIRKMTLKLKSQLHIPMNFYLKPHWKIKLLRSL